MEHSLVKTRLHDVEQEIARLNSLIADLNVEKQELQTADRVLARLSGGAERDQLGAENESEPKELISAKPVGLPTVREMIVLAIQNANKAGKVGLAPKGMTKFIRLNYWPAMNSNQVYSNVSRMVNELSELEKDEETGLYKLVEKIEAADNLISRSQSAAPYPVTTQQARESGSGGGT